MHMIENLKDSVIITTNIASISLKKKGPESHSVAPQIKWSIPNMSKESRQPFGSVIMILKLYLVKMFEMSFSCTWPTQPNIFQQYKLGRSLKLI